MGCFDLDQDTLAALAGVGNIAQPLPFPHVYCAQLTAEPFCFQKSQTLHRRVLGSKQAYAFTGAVPKEVLQLDLPVFLCAGLPEQKS